MFSETKLANMSIYILKKKKEIITKYMFGKYLCATAVTNSMSFIFRANSSILDITIVDVV